MYSLQNKLDDAEDCVAMYIRVMARMELEQGPGNSAYQKNLNRQSLEYWKNRAQSLQDMISGDIDPE